jgi:hypothetical protein
MNLDESQKQTVAKWIDEGLKLSEIQNRLASEFGIRMTYMELRFLMDDLSLKPKDPELAPSPPPPSPPAPGAIAPDKAAEPATEEENIPGAPGNVSVSVDQIARPGSLVSGKVVFSDGNSATWSLDQFGRLGLSPSTPNYRPSPPDLEAFQMALQNEMQKLGF